MRNVGKVGGGNGVPRWGKWKGVDVRRRGFLVLFKGGGCRVTPRFHPTVSDVNQGKEPLLAHPFLILRLPQTHTHHWLH